MDPTEFDQRIRPLLGQKNNKTAETSTPLKPNPQPCEHCSRIVDKQVTHIFLKWTGNQPHKYTKCANCHEILEKKLIKTK